MISAGRLFLIAVLALLAAAVLLLVSYAAKPLELGAAALRTVQGAFEPFGWRSLPFACAICVGLSVCVKTGAWLSSLQTNRGGGAPADLNASNVREAIAEVQRRLLRHTQKARPDIIRAFDELMLGAASVAASDIHVSPTPSALKLTYRVHGSLHEVASLPPELAAAMATRIKVLARLDTYVRGTPQDGRLVLDLPQANIEARVSTLPTELGERIVLRLVRGGRDIPDVADLGFTAEIVHGLRELLMRPQGLLFVTGSVGSGKTTTLYACLKHIANARGRTTTLVTLEDPIELELPFATQTQMHPKAGLTFASALRSVLRQDPNVLMVGEIRDRETAEIAMQAGLTGHLILTTVHGESALGPFARLADIGIEPFILASATLGCLSQRLVRTLCTACRRRAEPDPMHFDRLARLGVSLPEGQYFDAVGCEVCEGQGFVGRLPIAELVVPSAELRQAINERRGTAELHAIAMRQGMKSVLANGIERARAGETSLAEVLRVAG